ncbi:hypothetical protein [Actinoplanes sp. TFC3]|uniref:hypothetical protein n=1 Tax=Actinoplanes sp. TFC3 TaxID=1710355 RepID=UPI00082CF3BC|nr:hypothetical protein [Actinoplanes sp. TFC3]
MQERLESAGVTPAQVQSALEDGGDALYQAARSKDQAPRDQQAERGEDQAARSKGNGQGGKGNARSDSGNAGNDGDDWAKPFGGPLAVALLAAEVGALAAHLTSRASAVRAAAVEALLDEYSAVAVASRLGVSRQKVYDIARPGATDSFIDRTPWRQ